MKNETLEWATTRGWRVEQLNGGHYRLIHPEISDQSVTIAKTPGDRRHLKNVQAKVKWLERAFNVMPEVEGKTRIAPFQDEVIGDEILRKATCSHCGTVDTVTFQKGAAASILSPSYTRDRLLTRGWKLPRNRRDRDLCPICAKKELNGALAEKPKLEEPVQELAQAAPELSRTEASWEVILELPAPLQGHINRMVKSGFWGCNEEQVLQAIILSWMRENADGLRGEEEVQSVR